MSNLPKLPQFWTKLFKWICNDSFYEELQGDLEERFFINTEEKGIKKAQGIYRSEVIKMLRPSVMSLNKRFPKTFGLSIFRIHLILALRNMVRNKVFSAVNIFGLAAAIAVSLFMMNIIYSGYQLDTQHNDSERIYRVANYVDDNNGNKGLYASTSFFLSEKVEETIPDFETITHINTEFRPKFKINGTLVFLSGIYTDKDFFKLFNFKVILGNPYKIFEDINSMIITDKTAERLFPNENPIGKLTENGLVIRAVIESPKDKSHIPFSAITSLVVFNNSKTKPPFATDWTYYHNNFIYAKLNEHIKPESIKDKLGQLSAGINALPEVGSIKYDFVLQPIHGIVFSEKSSGEIGPGIGKERLYAFGALILVITLIASFNYTNLSIARAIQRTKEVGIRKVVGSSRWQIVSQFLLETIIFSLVGLVMGYLIYSYLGKSFTEIVPEFSGTFTNELNVEIAVLFFLFTLCIGVLAGIFPAMFFSKIKPLSLFNSKIKTKKLSFQTLRKVITGFQLTLSMFAILFVNLIIEQYKNLETTPLGFDQSGLLIIDGAKGNIDVIRNEFRKIPEVEGITITSNIPGFKANSGMGFENHSANDSIINVSFIIADDQFDEVFNPKLSMGSFFDKVSTLDILKPNGTFEILVNEEFIKALHLDRSNVIGQIIKRSIRKNDNTKYQIKGVLDDLVVPDFFGKSGTASIIINSQQPSNQYTRSKIILRIKEEDAQTAIAKLDAVWNRIYPNDSFQPIFFQQQFKGQFKELSNHIKLSSFLGSCIIAISLLGLFGMALYNAETRVKEIGIRKVLGARVRVIISLLLKNTLVTLTIATLIATPLVYQVFSSSFNNQLNTPTHLILHPWLFLKAIIALFVIILSLVVSLTWRTAKLNPSESLRNE